MIWVVVGMSMHPRDVHVAHGLVALRGFEIHAGDRTLACDDAIRFGVEHQQRFLGSVERLDDFDGLFVGEAHVRTPRGK